jgi:hypothetical protein
MKLSEFIAGLNKFSQLAGDLPVVVSSLEAGAETELHSIGINFDPTGNANGKVVLLHGPAQAQPQQPAAPATEPPAPLATDNPTAN